MGARVANRDLAKKTNQYKALKADLQYEKDEVAVLMRTEEILKCVLFL